jgi:ATP-dependent exoDNAse (exonuclease V) beta subunit
MDEEGFAERESRLMEERSDAVRILSIHKAKGLDFRIAIVAGLGMKKRSRGEDFLAESHIRRGWAARATFAGRSIRSPGWDELSDDVKRREEAEAIRLLYVALTRARDHLVISAHARSGAREGLSLADTRLAPLSSLLLDPDLVRSGLVRILDARELDGETPRRSAETAEWTEDPVLAYERECADLSRSLSRGLGAAGPGDAGEAEPGAPDRVRSRAARLGTAFHDAMESVDFGARGLAAGRLDALGVRHGLDREACQQLEAMIETTLSSPLMDRVRAASARGKRVLRELPWIRPASGPRAAEEGKIDLLFEEEHGWILVDYKTDHAPADMTSLAARHRDQILGYRDALASLGIPVLSAYLLFARTGDCVEIG